MDYYLQHHGILGMKWGIRRYQNEDGSLTEEGKKRKQQYKEINQYAEERRKYKQSMLNDIDDAINIGKKSIEAGRSVLHIYDRTQKNKQKNKQKSMDLSAMSDKELQQAINRMNLEDNYMRLLNNRMDVSKGRQIVQDILDNAGDALVIGGTLSNIVLSMKSLRG